MNAPRATYGVAAGARVVASGGAGLEGGATDVIDVGDEGERVAERGDGVSLPPARLTMMAISTSVASVAKIDDVTTRRVSLSSTTVPLMFFVRPEPRTVIAVPGVVEVGDAVSYADVAAVTLGATRVAIITASITIALNAIASRKRPADPPRTFELKAKVRIVQAPDPIAAFESTARAPRGRAVGRQHRYSGGAPDAPPMPRKIHTGSADRHESVGPLGCSLVSVAPVGCSTDGRISRAPSCQRTQSDLVVAYERPKFHRAEMDPSRRSRPGRMRALKVLLRAQRERVSNSDLCTPPPTVRRELETPSRRTRLRGGSDF